MKKNSLKEEIKKIEKMMPTKPSWYWAYAPNYAPYVDIKAKKHRLRFRFFYS